MVLGKLAQSNGFQAKFHIDAAVNKDMFNDQLGAFAQGSTRDFGVLKLKVFK